MKKVIKINPRKPEKKGIAKAAKIIRSGGVAVFPTETVYGLGCSPFRKTAVKRIFRIKGRAFRKPLSVIVSDFRQVKKLVRNMSPLALRLMSSHWPGPLTIIFRKSGRVPASVTGGSGTVGIRMPDHLITQELIRAAGTPLVATSANRSGRKPSTTAKSAAKAVEEADIVIDGGRSALRKPSTVIDLSGKKPKILRRGALKLEY